jgi:hypothetical protein
VNTAELQRLARDRVRDAKVLLASRRWPAAYYLVGYAVECALKCCVIRYLMRTDQFPERRFTEQCWTHNLDQLITLAGLRLAFDAALAGDPVLSANWTYVKDWSESSRYERPDKAQALTLFKAIVEPKHGVLAWIRLHW